MRVSVDRSDRVGFAAFREARRRGKVEIYLDGLPMTRVIAADDVLGFVRVHCTDADGRVVLNDAKDGTRQLVLYGTVRIEVAA